MPAVVKDKIPAMIKEKILEEAKIYKKDPWKLPKEAWGSGVSMVAPSTGTVAYTSAKLFPGNN